MKVSLARISPLEKGGLVDSGTTRTYGVRKGIRVKRPKPYQLAISTDLTEKPRETCAPSDQFTSCRGGVALQGWGRRGRKVCVGGPAQTRYEPIEIET